MSYKFLIENLGKRNLAEDLDDSTLAAIGRDVVEGYDRDMASRAAWEDHNEESLKLAAQVVEKKNFPWPDAANIKYPLLTTASLQFASRAYPALVPGVNVVKSRIVGYDKDGAKANRAINIGKHMSYQLMEEMDDWEDDMDRICMINPIIGCSFKKTYYDPLLGRNRSDLVLPSDFVIDYYAQSIETAYRKTHRIYFNQNEVHERVASGLFLDEDYGKAVVGERQESGIGGIIQPSDADGSSEQLFLEQHTFYDLDEDGYAEPYIITVDYKTRQVARITPRYDEEGILVNSRNEVVRVEPVEYFTKFGFIPNPDGSFYDLGFGTLLTPINETVNTTINQLLDAATLSNMQGGFLSRGIRMKGGNTRFQPGEWKVVNATGEDLRKGIVPLPTNAPSAVLFNLLSLMIESGQRLSSTVDVMLGETSGQNEKATTTLTRVQEGMRVFNSIYKRMHRSLKKEFKKLFRLNKLYLADNAYFFILDPGQEEVSQIGRSDYQDNNMDVIPYSDPNVATEQQRLAKAMGLLELLPLGTINPVEVTKRVLEAQDQYGVEQLMQMPPPQPDPNVMLEQQKFQHQVNMDTAEHNRKVIETKFNGIKAIADAESKEKGTQLTAYKTMLDELARQDTVSQPAMGGQEKMEPEEAEEETAEGGMNGDNEGTGEGLEGQSGNTDVLQPTE